jgi:D-amino-acid dehydrogenase
VEKAKRVLPGLRSEGGLERVGWRPLCPDTLPVIDRAPDLANLYFATGHGQLGVTLGATTGRLIADLVTGRRPNLDLAPYGATRF